MSADDKWADEIGKPAYESIAEMVAALECDYERLDELRQERDDWIESDGGDDDEQDRTPEDWAEEFGEEAKELKEMEEAAGECTGREEAEQRISEDALSVEVRSGWTTVGHPLEAEEFRILLATGGPAVQIRGELGSGNEPNRAWLEVQDWGKPWTQYFDADSDVLLTYSQQFYFG